MDSADSPVDALRHPDHHPAHVPTAEMLADGQRLVLEAARQSIQAVVTGRIAPDGQPSQDGSA